MKLFNIDKSIQHHKYCLKSISSLELKDMTHHQLPYFDLELLEDQMQFRFERENEGLDPLNNCKYTENLATSFLISEENTADIEVRDFNPKSRAKSNMQLFENKFN